MLENFEEAMERNGGETGAQRKKPKTGEEGEGQSATKLHRLLDMFKVGGGGGGGCLGLAAIFVQGQQTADEFVAALLLPARRLIFMTSELSLESCW